MWPDKSRVESAIVSSLCSRVGMIFRFFGKLSQPLHIELIPILTNILRNVTFKIQNSKFPPQQFSFGMISTFFNGYHPFCRAGHLLS